MVHHEDPVANVTDVIYTNGMNVREINACLSRGAADEPGVLPHAEQLQRQAFVFGFQFGLDALPTEPGILLVRGPRQYGKSTWLEMELRRTIAEFGPGSAYYLNGDEIPDAEALVARIRELLGMFDPRRGVRRLFVDEITAVSDWQRGLKRLADEGALRRVLVVTTGSRALDLRRGAERLPGRKGRLARTSYRFTPVSFVEFERVCGGHIGNAMLPAYILSGGSPVACAEVASRGSVPEFVYETVRDWIFGECAAAGRSRISLLAVMAALHRFGGSTLGQAKLARETGLANNTVAAGYIEMLSDLMCLSPCHAWDPVRGVAVQRKPCKYHFTNLLVASCWSPHKPRTVQEFLGLPPEVQGTWLEWTVAQELLRRRCISGEEVPEQLLFWQSKEHELDFVVGAGRYLEVKRVVTSPIEFSWFEQALRGAQLTVVSDASYEARSVRGITLEEFLRAT